MTIDSSENTEAGAEPDTVSEPRVFVSEIQFSGGSVVRPAKDDVIVIVGPNNSGKSAALRGIRDKVVVSEHNNPVVSTVRVQKLGTVESVAKWLETFTKVSKTTDNYTFEGLGTSIYFSHIEHQWSQGSCHSLGRFFVHLLGAEERLKAANPADSVQMTKEALSHPLHFLYRNDELEARLSQQFRRAFGVDLIVHRAAGKHIPLFVGTAPHRTAEQDRVSLEYLTALEKLDQLEFQGDGMRSFAGILLHAWTGKESILLIDEPEAFLHPPQARLIGQMLMSNQLRERQLFVATHSGDVLRGFLDAGTSRLRILRVRRDGPTNAVRELDAAKVESLWGDPLLRQTNVLDGLFHDRVVLCESDADCRFYSAVSEAVCGLSSDSRRPDLMFVHSGGKHRFPVVINAFRDLDVPVCAVLDFDVLSDEHPLRQIIEAAGGAWELFEKDWRIVKGAVDQRRSEIDISEVTSAITTILATPPGSFAELKSAVMRELRKSSPWAIAKTVGQAYVPSGDARRALDRLMASLESLRIFVVPVGELEGFVRVVGSHGPSWVNSVLRMDVSASNELQEARAFVARFAS